MINITGIVTAVIGLCVALITAFVIPFIKKHTTIKQRDIIQQAVLFAVEAAEQIYGSEKGQEKKEYVIQCLEEQGFSVNDSEIEAMVFELFNRFREDTDKTADDE